MKALMVLLMTSTPAFAEVFCNHITDKEVTDNLARDYGETARFVGQLGGDGHSAPMEIFISETGTWTMILIAPGGVCVIEAGTDWQIVEPPTKKAER